MKKRLRQISRNCICILLSVAMVLGGNIGGYVQNEVYADEAEYTYEILENGTISITGYTGSDVEVDIPAEIDGYTVSELGIGAFWNCSTLKSVEERDNA